MFLHSFRFFAALLLAVLLLPALAANPARAQELTPEQLARLGKYLPRTYAKLAKRDPNIHVVIVGDSISNFYLPNPRDRYATENAWWTRFLERMGGHFFYTGGVRDLQPKKLRRGIAKAQPGDQEEEEDDDDDAPRPAEPLRAVTGGPEFTVDNMARDGAVAIQALQWLTTEAFDKEPDLVIAMYGTNDAFSCVALKTYRQALEKAAAICKENQVDFILAGPPLITGEDDRNALAMTRPYAIVAREVAEAAGVFFFDAGAAQAECLNDDADAAAEDCFARVAAHVLEHYDHRGPVDYFHPNAASHRMMGDALWRQLINGRPVESIAVTAALTLPGQEDADGILELTFGQGPAHRVAQAASGVFVNGWRMRWERVSTPVAVGMLGIDRQWRPRVQLDEAQRKDLVPADAQLLAAPGGTLRIPFRRNKPEGVMSGARSDLGDGEDDRVRASFILCEGGRNRLVDVAVPIRPISVTFPRGRMENQAGEVVLTCTALNSGASEFDGSAELIWRGQSQSFPLKLAAGVKQPLRLRLPLPKDAEIGYLKGQLTLRFKSGSNGYVFQREVEAARNATLDRRTQLINRQHAVADANPRELKGAGEGPSASFVAADTGLFLVCDLPAADPNRSKSQSSAIIDVTIDARAPEKRGTMGFCDHIQLDVPWEDGKILLRRLQPAIFGDGYDRELNPKWLPASVTTQQNGRRFVRLSVPAAYFYLRGWKLGPDPQSALGLNVLVSLLEITPENPEGSFPLSASYSMVSSGMTRNDPQGLGALELSNQPSSRWSVRIY